MQSKQSCIEGSVSLGLCAETLSRVGILGMGSIGAIVARHMHAFGAKVLYHNRNKLPKECKS